MVNPCKQPETGFQPTPCYRLSSLPAFFRALFCLLFPVFCLLLNTVELSASTLRLTLDKNQVELGLPVKAVILATGHSHNLNNIDLSPLQESFGVRVDEFFIEEGNDDKAASDGNNQLAPQSLLLSLFARQTGAIIVPALTFHDATTKITSVNISDAIVRGKPLRISTSVSATRLWQRQQMIITASIETSEKFSSLEIENKTIYGMTSTLIQPEREWIKKDGVNSTRLHTGWILHPKFSGSQSPDLPVIRYKTGGTTEREFYLPRVRLQVKQLPPYIAPGIPVGKTSLSVVVDNFAIVQPETMVHWQIKLAGDSVLPSHLPAVLKQLVSDSSLVFLPADTTRNIVPDGKGIHGEVIHRVPFRPTGSGISFLPPLRIQYFDPASSRLEVITTPAIPIVSLSIVWQLLLACGIFSLIAGVLWLLYRPACKQIQRYACRNKALRTIEQATGWHELRTGLMLYARAMQWPDNTPLSQWRISWQSRFVMDKILNQVLDDIENACYGRRTTDSVQVTGKLLLSRLYRPSPLI